MVPHRNTVRVAVDKVQDGKSHPAQDVLAAEEPLEIRLVFDSSGKRVEQSVSITMRTPGDDFELAAGFLFTEGIVRSAGDIHQIQYCVGSTKEAQNYNVLSVQLNPSCRFDATRLVRNFYTTSSCGVCGKASIEALKVQGVAPISDRNFTVTPELVRTFSGKLRERQRVFEKTGGLHAAGLFDATGNLISLREDVGRHNAVDKLIGEQFLAKTVPLSAHLLLVSGRASFELVQKALVAGIPMLIAVGAPSSLAVELAKEYGMTLLGFLRDDRFNIYSGAERVAVGGAQPPT
jgi:FdhD protein